MGLSRNGTIHIVEVKSSIQDFRADNKWPEYQDYCDCFYFAAPQTMSPDVFPSDTGFISADRYGAEIRRPAETVKISSARRRTILLAFARHAANQLHGLNDPNWA